MMLWRIDERTASTAITTSAIVTGREFRSGLRGISGCPAQGGTEQPDKKSESGCWKEASTEFRHRPPVELSVSQCRSEFAAAGARRARGKQLRTVIVVAVGEHRVDLRSLI